jgi:hypothetical protein
MLQEEVGGDTSASDSSDGGGGNESADAADARLKENTKWSDEDMARLASVCMGKGAVDWDGVGSELGRSVSACQTKWQRIRARWEGTEPAEEAETEEAEMTEEGEAETDDEEAEAEDEEAEAEEGEHGMGDGQEVLRSDNQSKRWKATQDAHLYQCRADGMDWPVIARDLGRTAAACVRRYIRRWGSTRKSKGQQQRSSSAPAARSSQPPAESAGASEPRARPEQAARASFEAYSRKQRHERREAVVDARASELVAPQPDGAALPSDAGGGSDVDDYVVVEAEETWSDWDDDEVKCMLEWRAGPLLAEESASVEDPSEQVRAEGAAACDPRARDWWCAQSVFETGSRTQRQEEPEATAAGGSESSARLDTHGGGRTAALPLLAPAAAAGEEETEAFHTPVSDSEREPALTDLSGSTTPTSAPEATPLEASQAEQPARATLPRSAWLDGCVEVVIDNVWYDSDSSSDSGE